MTSEESLLNYPNDHNRAGEGIERLEFGSVVASVYSPVANAKENADGKTV